MINTIHTVVLHPNFQAGYEPHTRVHSESDLPEAAALRDRISAEFILVQEKHGKARGDWEKIEEKDDAAKGLLQEIGKTALAPDAIASNRLVC